MSWQAAPVVDHQAGCPFHLTYFRGTWFELAGVADDSVEHNDYIFPWATDVTVAGWLPPLI